MVRVAGSGSMAQVSGAGFRLERPHKRPMETLQNATTTAKHPKETPLQSRIPPKNLETSEVRDL